MANTTPDQDAEPISMEIVPQAVEGYNARPVRVDPARRVMGRDAKMSVPDHGPDDVVEQPHGAIAAIQQGGPSNNAPGIASVTLYKVGAPNWDDHVLVSPLSHFLYKANTVVDVFLDMRAMS